MLCYVMLSLIELGRGITVSNDPNLSLYRWPIFKTWRADVYENAWALTFLPRCALFVNVFAERPNTDCTSQLTLHVTLWCHGVTSLDVVTSWCDSVTVWRPGVTSDDVFLSWHIVQRLTYQKLLKCHIFQPGELDLWPMTLSEILSRSMPPPNSGSVCQT